MTHGNKDGKNELKLGFWFLAVVVTTLLYCHTIKSHLLCVAGDAVALLAGQRTCDSHIMGLFECCIVAWASYLQLSCHQAV